MERDPRGEDEGVENGRDGHKKSTVDHKGNKEKGKIHVQDNFLRRSTITLQIFFSSHCKNFPTLLTLNFSYSILKLLKIYKKTEMLCQETLLSSMSLTIIFFISLASNELHHNFVISHVLY